MANSFRQSPGVGPVHLRRAVGGCALAMDSQAEIDTSPAGVPEFRAGMGSGVGRGGMFLGSFRGPGICKYSLWYSSPDAFLVASLHRTYFIISTLGLLRTIEALWQTFVEHLNPVPS